METSRWNILVNATNEELQELVNDALLKWKPILPFIMVDEKGNLIGFEKDYIAVAEVTQCVAFLLYTLGA